MFLNQDHGQQLQEESGAVAIDHCLRPQIQDFHPPIDSFEHLFPHGPNMWRSIKWSSSSTIPVEVPLKGTAYSLFDF